MPEVGSVEEASRILHISADRPTSSTSRGSNGEANRVKRIEHPDGTFEYILHSQVEPSASMRASTVPALITAAVQCLRYNLSGKESSSSRDFLPILDDEEFDFASYYWDLATAAFRQILFALVNDSLSALMIELLERPWDPPTDASAVIYLLAGLLHDDIPAYVGQTMDSVRRCHQHFAAIGDLPLEPEHTPSLKYQYGKKIRQEGKEARFIILCNLKREDGPIIKDLVEALTIILLQTCQGSQTHLGLHARFGLIVTPFIGLNSIPGNSSGRSWSDPIHGINPSLDIYLLEMGSLRQHIDTAKAMVVLESRYTATQILKAKERIAKLTPILEAKAKAYQEEKRNLIRANKFKALVIEQDTGSFLLKMLGGGRQKREKMLMLFDEEELKGTLEITVCLTSGTDLFLVLDPLQRVRVGDIGLLLCNGTRTVPLQKRITHAMYQSRIRFVDFIAGFVEKTSEQLQKESQAASLIRQCPPNALAPMARRLYIGFHTYIVKSQSNPSRFILPIIKVFEEIFLTVPLSRELAIILRRDNHNVLLRLDLASAYPLLHRWEPQTEEEVSVFKRVGLEYSFRGAPFEPVKASLGFRRERTASKQKVIDALLECFRYWLTLPGSHLEAPLIPTGRQQIQDVHDAEHEPRFCKIHRLHVSAFAFWVKNPFGTWPVLDQGCTIHIPADLRREYAPTGNLPEGFSVNIKIDSYMKTRWTARLYLQKYPEDGASEPWYDLTKFRAGVAESLEEDLLPEALWTICEAVNTEAAKYPPGATGPFWEDYSIVHPRYFPVPDDRIAPLDEDIVDVDGEHPLLRIMTINLPEDSRKVTVPRGLCWGEAFTIAIPVQMQTELRRLPPIAAPGPMWIELKIRGYQRSKADYQVVVRRLSAGSQEFRWFDRKSFNSSRARNDIPEKLVKQIDRANAEAALPTFVQPQARKVFLPRDEECKPLEEVIEDTAEDNHPFWRITPVWLSDKQASILLPVAMTNSEMVPVAISKKLRAELQGQPIDTLVPMAMDLDIKIQGPLRDRAHCRILFRRRFAGERVKVNWYDRAPFLLINGRLEEGCIPDPVWAVADRLNTLARSQQVGSSAQANV